MMRLQMFLVRIFCWMSCLFLSGLYHQGGDSDRVLVRRGNSNCVENDFLRFVNLLKLVI